MDRDADRSRNLTRRALALGAGKLGLFGLLGARLYHLQVQEADRYRVLAEENRINVRLIPPSRGPILDRHGDRLAVNDQNFRVVMVPEQAGDVTATLDRLAGIVDLPDETVERVLRDAERRRAFVPLMVTDNLTWEQVSRLEVNAPELPGLSIEVGDLRRYPYGDATAHILGYVGAVSESELTGDPVLALPGFRIGKSGAERQYDETLRGQAGTRQVEVNAIGRVIRELSRQEGSPGTPVSLTVDIDLQERVQYRLAAERSASAAVIDARTGEVYALASHPSFDPNLFTAGIGQDDWNRLIGDRYAPLTNKVVSGQYAPGSTFKMLVGLAALEAGEIDENYSVWCPGHMDLGNHRFHCWRRGGHGRMNLVDAIAESCDTYFYDLSLKVGIDRIAEMANRFGLGRPVGIDLPGEADGLMPNKDWKQAALGQPWQLGETLIASIGQGYVLATPLQLATMTARMVNGGRAVTPHLHRDLGMPADIVPEMGIPQAHLDLVHAGMVEVTHGRRGTARGAQIQVEGWEMAGKTGTSQVRRISQAERATGIIPNEERPWHLRDHALFVGYAPVTDPRYVVSVVVEHGGGGSAVAAPIARDILRAAQEIDPAGPVPAPAPGPLGALPTDRQAG